jgi:hypothetical protein
LGEMDFEVMSLWFEFHAVPTLGLNVFSNALFACECKTCKDIKVES